MLSNKMTVSLMSLITIFALAFVAPAAIAGTFGADLVMDSDISHQDGLQLPNGELSIQVKYAKAIVLTAANVFITITDADGNTSIPTVAAAVGTLTNPVIFAPATAAQTITFTVPAAIVGVGSKVEIKIAKGIKSADVIDEDTTDPKTFTVNVVSDTDPAAGPDVLKIALVGEPFATVTTSEFQVHVLLSEDVRKDGLKAGGLDVGDATIKSVVKLASPGTLPMIVSRTQTTDAGIEMEAAAATWRDTMVHLYLVTLTTKGPGEKTATIKVKDFVGNEKLTAVGDSTNSRADVYTGCGYCSRRG